MLVCGECGARNEDGEDFCGECGAYLDWDAEQVATDPEPVPVAAQGEDTAQMAAANDEQPRGLVERVREAVGIGSTTDAPVLEPAPETTPPTERPAAEPAPTARPSAVGAAAGPPGAAPPGQPPEARRPSPDQPGAVRPGAAVPKPRRRPAAPVQEPIDHGDLVCGRCGTGNKPTRKFCRRCGHDLVDAVVAKVPWWKRIFRRSPKAPAAGTRPRTTRRRRRGVPKLLVLLVVLGLLGAAGWSYRDKAAEAYAGVMDRVLGSEPFHPVMSASSSAPGAPARRANDGASNTFWAPAGRGRGEGQYLRAAFDKPIRLLHVIITPGVSTEEPKFLRNGRPDAVRVRVRDTDGNVFRQRVELQDKAGPQSFDVTHDDVERIRLTIVSSRRGSVPGSRVAIAEVEFLGRD